MSEQETCVGNGVRQKLSDAEKARLHEDVCQFLHTDHIPPHSPIPLEAEGYEIRRRLVMPEVVEHLRTVLGPVNGAGRRGLLAEPEIAEFARHGPPADLMRDVLGPAARPVRAIYFNKTAETSWLVPWHQDLSIAVPEKSEVEGYGPWSVKDGVPHVQPPVAVLEGMLTLRLHLDDCDESNGALRVIAGSHRHGRLSAERIQEMRKSDAEVLCRAAEGDVLLMRPLLLHASGHATGPRQRRVLHIEYAACELPKPLRWLD